MRGTRSLFAALWRVDGQINCISDAALRFCIRDRNMPSRRPANLASRRGGAGRQAAGLPILLWGANFLHLTEQAKFVVAREGRVGIVSRLYHTPTLILIAWHVDAARSLVPGLPARLKQQINNHFLFVLSEPDLSRLIYAKTLHTPQSMK